MKLSHHDDGSALPRQSHTLVRMTAAASLLTAAVLLSCVPIPIETPGTSLPFELSVVMPEEVVVVGAANQDALVKWVDTGTPAGSVVRVEMERPNPNGGGVIISRVLVGRDAVADGSADEFIWDGTDTDGTRLPGDSYTVRVIMDAPDGEFLIRTAPSNLVVPFTFRGAGLADDDGAIGNSDGAGPFELTDANATFVDDGVTVGQVVSVLSGSGVTIGDFPVTQVTQTTLRLGGDAGDSGGIEDVVYFVTVASPTIGDPENPVIVAWTDSEPASTIELAADPDAVLDNGNEIVLAESIDVAPDGDMDRFAITGVDAEGERLPAGPYNIVATVDKGSAGQVVQQLLGGAAVIVGNAPPTLEITDPASNSTVTAGASVGIFFDADDPDDVALITLLVDPDPDETDAEHDSGNEMIIATDIEEIVADPQTFNWDTAGTPEGTYTIVGIISDGVNDPVMDSAPGRLTLPNSPPQVIITRPSGEMASVANNGGAGPFELTDASADFVAAGVSAGDSVEITAGTGVEDGTYTIDDVAATVLTLESDAGDSGGTADVEYQVTGNISVIAGTTFDLEFETTDPEDPFTFDFVLDYDSDGNNGNELEILSNRAAPQGGPTADTFSWDTTGVPLGVYRLFARSDDGINTDRIDEYDGKLIVRTGANEPFLVLTSPASTSSPNVGSKVTVAWEDESTDENALIDLVFDDDPDPAEASETDDDEQTLVGSFAMNLNADEDGAEDIFQWDWHPDEITRPAVPEGEYRIFAYINNDALAFGNSADLDDAGGGGPFRLIDEDADFIVDGVTTSDMVRIGGGTGSTPGLYAISAVAATELTLTSNAGDSASAGDVAYNVNGPRDAADTVAVAAGRVNIPDTPPELEFQRPFGREAALAMQTVSGADISVLTDPSAGFLTRGVAVGHMLSIDGGTGTNTGDYDVVAVTATSLTVSGDAGDSGADTNVRYEVLGDLEAEPGTAPIIEWFDRDPDAVTINIDLFLDPDSNRSNGNEIQIANNLTKSPRPDVLNTFTWTGTDDLVGDEVESGEFTLFATLDDGVNDEVEVVSPDNVNLRFDDDIVSGATADVTNNGGAGPFVLTQPGATFNVSGVQVGDVLRITGGTGVTPGLYRIIDRTSPTLTIQGDAGDSGAAGDVTYSVFRPAPTIVLISQQTASTATQGSSVTIEWRDQTVIGNERVELYRDVDGDPTMGGANGGLGEVIELNLAAVPDGNSDRFTWNLPLSGPDFVPEGTYFVHARLVSSSLQKDISTSRETVEVVGPNIVPTLDFLQPGATVDTVLGGPAVLIEWEYSSGTSGTISLEIDQDQTANNGEQFTILSNRPQAGAPAGATDSLNWTLVDNMSAAVPTGEYFLRGRLAVTGQSPVTDVLTPKIIIRKTAGDPVVTLTAPTADTQLTTGDSTTITIEWDLDDPTGMAVVDLWYDTSPDSDGGAAPPRDGAFIEQDLAASARSALWNVPNSLATGLYYIHARIEQPGGDDDDRSTAIGRLRIVDPN